MRQLIKTDKPVPLSHHYCCEDYLRLPIYFIVWPLDITFYVDMGSYKVQEFVFFLVVVFLILYTNVRNMFRSSFNNRA